jgi:hypothetical protein
MEKELSLLAQKFIRAYSNLPVKTRQEIFIVVNGEPITWKVAYVEIIKETALGKEILKSIKKIGFID